MKSRKLYKKEWVEWAIKNGIEFTQEEVEAAVQKHNDMMSQSVPWNNGARLVPRSTRIASNNIDRMTKWRTDTIYFPRDLNVHDPEDKLVWAEPALPAWVWVLRAAVSVAFFVGIYCLVLLGLSF
jgi:hypothetical protein